MTRLKVIAGYTFIGCCAAFGIGYGFVQWMLRGLDRRIAIAPKEET